RPSLMFTATTDGSFRMMPRPRTYTRVLAVPRSMAMSRPNRENRLSAMRFDSPRSQHRGMSPKVGEALPSRLGLMPAYLLSPRFTPPTGTGLSGDSAGQARRMASADGPRSADRRHAM